MNPGLERLRDPSEKTLALLLLAPAFLLLALIVVYPIGKLIWNSFFDLRLSGGGEAVQVRRLENYALTSGRTMTSGTPPATRC
jgi:ABC-type sugar transport system permease subunit